MKRKSEQCDGRSDPAGMEVVPTRTGDDLWAEFYDGEDNPLVLLEELHIGALAGEVAGLVVADMAAVRAGLTLEHVSEHAVDTNLAARSLRAGKYLGWPMLLLMKLVPGSPNTCNH